MDEHASGEGAESRSRGWLLERCPTCSSDALVAVLDVDEPNFFCPACGRCWHVELGFVSRVDPLTCVTCQGLGDCAADLPSVASGETSSRGSVSSTSSNEK
jgi:hypothetical protein